jgi:hypothetical protein
MNRDVEDESKTLFAQMIADFEAKTNKKIFNSIASGLTSGTSESDFFQRAYIKRYIILQTKK